MSGSNEVAGLLDRLANVSLDPGQGLAESSKTELPSSTLERLHQLVKLLEGKQLLVIMDYAGASQALEYPNKVLERFLRLYPTAIVQRATKEEASKPGVKFDFQDQLVTETVCQDLF